MASQTGHLWSPPMALTEKRGEMVVVGKREAKRLRIEIERRRFVVPCFALISFGYFLI